jgi:hypothetical protein
VGRSLSLHTTYSLLLNLKNSGDSYIGLKLIFFLFCRRDQHFTYALLIFERRQQSNYSLKLIKQRIKLLIINTNL